MTPSLSGSFVSFAHRQGASAVSTQKTMEKMLANLRAGYQHSAEQAHGQLSLSVTAGTLNHHSLLEKPPLHCLLHPSNSSDSRLGKLARSPASVSTYTTQCSPETCLRWLSVPPCSFTKCSSDSIKSFDLSWLGHSLQRGTCWPEEWTGWTCQQVQPWGGPSGWPCGSNVQKLGAQRCLAGGGHKPDSEWYAWLPRRGMHRILTESCMEMVSGVSKVWLQGAGSEQRDLKSRQTCA